MSDIIVTWPKRRLLRSYLRELERARMSGRVVNFRVPHPPRGYVDRCYIVYDGHVVGYSEVIDVVRRRRDTVVNVESGGFWPPGWYIVRKPILHKCAPHPMRGFRGWRWFDRSLAPNSLAEAGNA